jgi:general secretion pathway protein K
MGGAVDRNRNEAGIAIIAVLWALVLLSLVAAALSFETRTEAHIARNMADKAAARAAADAGIQRAILDLLASLSAQSNTWSFRDNGTAYAPLFAKAYVWPFANTTVQISLQDQVGRVDLNKAPEEVLARLFGAVGVDSGTARSLAAAIADFRDVDNFVRLGGAEENEYRAAGLTWGPKNAPFQAVEELRQVLGMTAEIYERVAPYVTIYSMMGRYNPIMTTDPILSRLGFDSQYLATFPGLVYSVRAEAKGPNNAVFVRKAVVQLFQQRNQFQILAWR